MKQVLAVRVGAKKAVGAHCVEEVVAYCACSFFRGTFSSQKKCLFLAPWKISGMRNI